ncbi:MAG: hypothetical protein M1268_00965 [Patescibacteria group bacterium]|nr:hypothetical protein [Patescibacteria group bacterium]
MALPIHEMERPYTNKPKIESEELDSLTSVNRSLNRRERRAVISDIRRNRRRLGKGYSTQEPQTPDREKKSNISPFVKGVEIGTATGVAVFGLAACAPKEATPIQPSAIVEPSNTPTAESLLKTITPIPQEISTSTPKPIETATSTSIPTPESTPIPEIVFNGTNITEKSLVNGLKNMGGGGEVPSIEGEKATRQELSPVEYAKKAWPKEDFSGNFSEDPVKVLEYLAAETSYVGADEETVNFSVYPNLSENGDPLRTKRFKINEFPNGALELKLDPANENSPILKKGTDIIEIARGKDEKGQLQTVIVFTDYSEGGVPRHRFAMTPVEKQAGENSPVSLEELEQMAGSTLKVEGQDVVVDLKPKNGTQRKWKLNTIASSLFTKIKEKIIKQNAPEPSVAQQETLQIEGLKQVWNQEKQAWEYFDQKDNLLVGSWNKDAKKFELDENLTVLRGEWKGLYVSETPQEAEKAFNESVDIQNQKARIPIPFKFTEGEIIKGKSLADFFAVHGVTLGKEFYAPFGGKVEKGAASGVGGDISIAYLVGPITLKIYFKDNSDYLGGVETGTGSALMRFDDKFISRETLLFPNPGDYQTFLYFLDNPDSKGWNLSFKNNLLFDDQGRVVTY